MYLSINYIDSYVYILSNIDSRMISTCCIASQVRAFWQLESGGLAELPQTQHMVEAREVAVAATPKSSPL